MSQPDPSSGRSSHPPGPSSQVPPSVPGPVRPTRSKGGLLAIGISLVALLLAFGSAVFAWRAIDQAKDAKDIAIGRAPVLASNEPPATQPEPTTVDPGQTPGEESAAPDGGPRSPGEPPALGERTVYKPHYEKQVLRLAAQCNSWSYVDLDEPRVNVGSSGYDLRLSMGCNNAPSRFNLGYGVDGSDAAQIATKPQECADLIRAAPIPREGSVPVRKGIVICLTTDYAAARERGDEWRMVLVEVVAIGNDGAVTVQATAWDIPG